MNLLVETSVLNWIYLIMQQKTDLKEATGVKTFTLAAKADLTHLKAEVDKVDVDKLKSGPLIWAS